MAMGTHKIIDKTEIITVNGIIVKNMRAAHKLIVQLTGKKVSYSTIRDAFISGRKTYAGIKIHCGQVEKEKKVYTEKVHHTGEPLIKNPVTCGISTNFRG
jgi:hypothetical protein